MDSGQKNLIAGFLTEKSGRWYMVLTIKDPNSGKFKPKWISTKLPIKGNKKRAEAMLMEARKEYTAMSNAPGAEHNILFADYIQKWLLMMRPQLEPSTYLSYHQIIDNHIAPYFREKGYLLVDVSPKIIQEYYDYLMMERGLSASSVRKYHANIRKCLQQAVRSDIIASNPADKTDKPKIKPYISSYYDAETLKLLFKLLQGNKLELPVSIAAYYGLRRSEVLGLRWSAINFRNKTISINHTISVGLDDNMKRTLYRKDRGKNRASLRTLPLMPEVERALAAHKEWQRNYIKLCGNCYSRENIGYIFTDELGELIKPNYITQGFKTFLEKNELPKIRFHDLRHSCASLLISKGVPIKEIQIWLGHADYSTTANIYSHVDTTSKQTSADVISGLLNNSGIPLVE